MCLNARMARRVRVAPLFSLSFYLGALIWGLLVTMPVSAALILATVPNGSAQHLRQLYSPLERYLTMALHEKVRFRDPANLYVLGLHLRQHKDTIVFAGPHVVAWAMKNARYVPVLAGTGVLHLVVVSRKPGVTLSSLRGAPVCALAPPNLATMVLLNKYAGHVATPYLLITKSLRAEVAAVLKGTCEAATVPLRMARTALNSGQVHEVTDLGVFPDMAFAAYGSPRLLMRIRLAFRTGEAQQALAPLAKAYRIPGWQQPKPAMYRGLAHLLAETPGFSH